MLHTVMLKRLALMLFTVNLACVSACGEGGTVSGGQMPEARAESPAGTEEQQVAQTTADVASPVLVAYYAGQDSETGQAVQDIAGMIGEGIGGTVYAIDGGQAVGGADEDITAPYDCLFLGYAVQDNTAPDAVLSFLAGQELAGKTVFPFCIHGGEGAGDSFEAIAAAAPDAAVVLPGFGMQADACAAENVYAYVSAWVEGLYTQGYL